MTDHINEEYIINNRDKLENLIEKFVFIPEVDQRDNDIYEIHNLSIIEMMKHAINDDNCICFNSLGFFKNNINKLEPSQYITTQYGIYIKKEHYTKISDNLPPIYNFPKFDTNSTYMHAGRFGNQFFVSMALHFIGKKNNMLCFYSELDNFKKLGINLFSGNNIYEESIRLNDDNFYNMIVGEQINKNIIIRNTLWCQTKEFALYLKGYFNRIEQKSKIIEHNLFKDNYYNNNDVYVHVRLGDIINNYGQYNHPYEYYDKILEKLQFKNGYISSDNIENILCVNLIKKYNLKIIKYNIVETLMFASTCKNIILSHGTFSWMIGIFSYYSDIYYPKVIKKWHGDIFVFPEWNEVSF
jgi:hypothetical protein